MEYINQQPLLEKFKQLEIVSRHLSNGVLNVVVELIALQSSRLRRDGSRASTSHWARKF